MITSVIDDGHNGLRHGDLLSEIELTMGIGCYFASVFDWGRR